MPILSKYMYVVNCSPLLGQSLCEPHTSKSGVAIFLSACLSSLPLIPYDIPTSICHISTYIPLVLCGTCTLTADSNGQGSRNMKRKRIKNCSLAAG